MTKRKLRINGHSHLLPYPEEIDLKTFNVSLETSKLLSDFIPDEFVKVSESGISSIEAIKELQPYGYKGFLIGENFMKTDNPGKSATQFIKNINS